MFILCFNLRVWLGFVLGEGKESRVRGVVWVWEFVFRGLFFLSVGAGGDQKIGREVSVIQVGWQIREVGIGDDYVGGSFLKRFLLSSSQSFEVRSFGVLFFKFLVRLVFLLELVVQDRFEGFLFLLVLVINQCDGVTGFFFCEEFQFLFRIGLQEKWVDIQFLVLELVVFELFLFFVR